MIACTALGRLREVFWIDLCGKARGDCWWLVAEVYRRRGIDLVGLAADRFDDWQEVSSPEPGDVLLTVTGDRTHVGVYLGEDDYLHADDGRLVSVKRVGALRRAGRSVRFLRHAGVKAASVVDMPSQGRVRVVYVPDPVGRADYRQTWFRDGVTLGECAPAGANVVMTPAGPRRLIEVADQPAGECAVYATLPEGAPLVIALIGLALSVAGTIVTLLTAPPASKGRQDLDSPTFDLSGIHNTAATGVVQPVVYGSHRAAGNFISAVQHVDANGKAVFYGLILLSRGPVQSIGGLTADADDLSGANIPSSIKLDDNPASNYPCSVSIRLGNSEQTPVPGFNETATSVPYSSQLLQSVPFTHATSQAVTGFDALVTYPGGLVEYDDDPPNDPYAITMTFTVRWRIVGAASWNSETWTHTNGIGGQISFQFSKRNLTLDKYEIQVERQTAAAPFSRQLSDSYMLGVNEIVAAGLSYPGCALLGIRLVGSDQLAGGVPTITAEVQGAKVQVWDGVSTTAPAFTLTYTRNPAWIALDVLLNRDYGLGRGARMTVDQVNLQDFLDFATYCDASVSDGRGGSAARAYCDHVADTAKSGWDLAREIVYSGFGRLYLAGGKARIYIEQTGSPVFMFTAGNTRDMKASYNGRRNRPNACEVSYLNRETDYEPDAATKLDDSGVLTSGEPIRKESIAGTGITRAYQAYRLAQRRINEARYQGRRYEWTSGPESIHLIPGDLVYVHGSALGVGIGGRLLDATGTTVKLDRTITLGARARLVVTKQDDTTETAYIAAGTYARNTAITLVNSSGAAFTWSVTPAAASKWIIPSTSDQSVEPVKARIEGMSVGPSMDCRFTAAHYDARIYNDDPGDVETFTDSLPDGREMPPSVSYLKAEGVAPYSCDGTAAGFIRVTFQTTDEWTRGEVWYRRVNSAPTSEDDRHSWIFHGWARGHATIYAGCGAFQVCVRACSPKGTTQSFADAAKAHVYLRGRREAPDAPSAVTAAVTLGILTVTVTQPTDPSVVGYRINYGGDTYAGSVPLVALAGPTWSGPCPFVGTETIYVRSVSRSGAVSGTSVTASVTNTTPESAYTDDVNSDDHTGFAGTKTNTAVTGTELQLSGADSGTYQTADKSTVVTKEVQEIRLRARCDLADVAMTWDEATFTWSGYLGTYLTWATANLSGSEVVELDDPTWAQAGFTWGDLQGTLRTWGGPPDVYAALTPVVEYDVNTGGGYSGSWTAYKSPPSVSNLTGVRSRVTLRRPHSRYDPRLVQFNTRTLIVGGSEPERMTTDFVVTSATAAGTSIRGAVNSTNVQCAITAPSGKKAVPLTISGVATAGATAGTYTVDFGFYNVTDGKWTTLVSGTGTAGATITASTTLTRASATLSFTGGKFFFVGYRNNASSPGALANTVHRVTAGYIYEDV